MKCPFSKNLDCKDCRLYRRGIRLVGLEQREEEVAGCVFHLALDNVEVLHKRVIALQKEIGEMKNSQTFSALSYLGSDTATEELRRMTRRQFLEIVRETTPDTIDPVRQGLDKVTGSR